MAEETFAAHHLSDAALGGPIRIQDGAFTDIHGRVLALRGLNVSGASKLPTTPNGLSHLTDGFYEHHRTVTFAGRPFPLDEAPLHFARLRAWGLPLVRLLVTWEALGHAGPHELDLEYIAYLRALVDMMPRYGIKCFVCAHQDVWSRFSGGSGAPGWTFEAAGLDIEAFTDTGAAYVHGQDEQRRANGLVDKREPSGPFLWPSGYQKLAASTMATLFWAGDALAPQLKCGSEEVSIQTHLQDAFVEAFGTLADALSDLEACLGFEPLNEPHRGLVNLHDFHGWNYDTDLHIGHYPSFAQALALGSGYAQTVKFYVKSWPFPTRVSHKSIVDPKGRSAWLVDEGEARRGMGQCVWRAHGVWEWDEKKKTPVVLNKEYFDTDHRPGRQGNKIEWYRDCYAPFLKKFSDRVSRKSPRQMAFIEPIPNEFIPPWPAKGSENKSSAKQKYAVQTVIDTPRPANFVYAPHFYDLNVLFSKHHAFMSVNVQGLSRGMFVLKGLYFGAQALRRNYKTQIGNVARHGQLSLGAVPTVIGEVGIPYDINGSAAFATGWYDKQRELMNALISAMEDNAVGFTLWNYNPHNRFEYGDGWNKEDFSVINGDDVDDHGSGRQDYRNRAHEDDDLYRGGRVLDVVIRPYAAKIAGKPIRSNWDHRTLRFDFEWSSKGVNEKPAGDKARLTEIFVPNYHYAKHELRIKLSDGDWSYDAKQQTLLVRQGNLARHSLTVEISRVREHLLRRALERRQGGPPDLLLDLVPPSLEAWFEEQGLDYLFEEMLVGVPVLIVLLAVVVQLYRVLL
ncbi:glycoside hydrolase superfamily [Dactylonectria estremocensis]|uniref:Glycoside hydrolase superfamily n=1 Tax=Dactylonectria estremocensis TaxID=1079267 RepID=A0A9P9J544_9HYPO|nr:glycoside hydrolase superfamily [Dactylonectria estremocensis]